MILLVILVLLYAYAEAQNDIYDTRNHITIDHVERWVKRLCVGVGVCLILSRFFGGFVPMLFFSAFAFSSFFRIFYNKGRNLPIFYVAPWSNVYDRVMFKIANPGSPVRANKLYLEIEKAKYFEIGNWLLIHKAGKIAYIIEAVIAATSIIIHYATK